MTTYGDWLYAALGSLDGYVSRRDGIIDVRLGGAAGSRDEMRDRQTLAALLLDQTPFGFSWEDVDALRSASVVFNYGDDSIGEDEAKTARLRDVAARIADLLPPRP